MGIREHIERRQPNPTIAPIVERRGGTEQRALKWWERAEKGELYGYDEDGKPVAKDMSGSLRLVA